jgi:DNA repair photolyase
METQIARKRTSSKQVIWADSFADGVSFGKHQSDDKTSFDLTPLSLELDDQVGALRSRYNSSQHASLAALEGRLALLQRRGELQDSITIFGVDADPFHPFEARFDMSMKFLNLFEKYSAGQLVIQTRSPLLVIAMPVLRQLKDRLLVTIPIETSSPEAVAKYTPHLPKLSERLRVASVLRRFGIPIHMQVAPMLPYGDMKKDAAAFASMLTTNADYISVKPIYSGLKKGAKQPKSAVMEKLASERNFSWLRPDACKHLLQCVELLAPKKLELPNLKPSAQKQLSIFAA